MNGPSSPNITLGPSLERFSRIRFLNDLEHATCVSSAYTSIVMSVKDCVVIYYTVLLITSNICQRYDSQNFLNTPHAFFGTFL